MERYYTIGIAGHIDHGKTTLTKRLTNVDTDRLKEERERKISIELGFAPFILPDGKKVGIVDVPGHERFIRQMIAGVAGIDLVLLVIAADEGIMPQTREHFDILTYLGVQNGIVVITKKDLVDEEWLQLVQSEVAEWVKGSPFGEMPMIPVSAETGEGVDQLVNQIQSMLSELPGRDISGPFRLPVDRVFTKKGIGTVVTGTVYQGQVQEGDRLELLPQQQEVKVRQVHVHNEQQQRAYAGQRVALNLTGVEKEYINRGDTLVRPGFFEATQRIDIRLHMLKDLDFSIKQRSRVRLHAATSEVIGKLVFFDRNELMPGEEVFAQLQLEEPIVVKKGDPFILRRLSPMTTIGGGRIIDPYAARYKFGSQTVDKLKSKDQDDPSTTIRTFIQERGFSSVAQAARHLALDESLVREWVEQDREQKGILYFAQESFVVDRTAYENWKSHMASLLKPYHEKHPMRPGMRKSELKSKHYHFLPEKLWNLLLEHYEQQQQLKVKDDWISLYDFHPHIPDELQEKSQRLLKYLEDAGVQVPEWDELLAKADVQIKPGQGEDLKSYFIIADVLVQLNDRMVLSRRVMEEKIKEMKEHEATREFFSPAEAKEVLQVSRKYLIPFLELLDEEGYTARHENKRRWLSGPGS